MAASLPILIVKKPPEVRNPKLNPLLPNLPWLGVCVGGVKSGKSNLITNLVLNDSFYRGYFEQIALISPTAQHDMSINPITKGSITTTYDQYDDAIIEHYVDMAKKEIEDGEKPIETLIILDDCVGMFDKTSKVCSLATRYRHYRISILISTQFYKAVPPMIRANATWWVLLKISNDKEIEKIDDEFSSSIPGFNAIYRHATKGKFQFLFVDMREMRCLQNFDKVLWAKE